MSDPMRSVDADSCHHYCYVVVEMLPIAISVFAMVVAMIMIMMMLMDLVFSLENKVVVPVVSLLLMLSLKEAVQMIYHSYLSSPPSGGPHPQKQSYQGVVATKIDRRSVDHSW